MLLRSALSTFSNTFLSHGVLKKKEEKTNKIIKRIREKSLTYNIESDIEPLSEV